MKLLTCFLLQGRDYIQKMKISRLLELHHQAHPEHTVEHNLGDGFLLKNNPTYRRIRCAAVNLEFLYTSDMDPAYLALPLSQLENVIRSKKISYIDNVSVLRVIEKKIPETTDWDEVRDNLKRNSIFHESCHAIAHHEACLIFAKPDHSQMLITRLLVEESFSNTCELLAIIEAEQTAHRIFYEANSYIFMYEDRVLLKDSVAVFGREIVFKFMILCYLHSNFLGDRLEDKDFERILKSLPLAKTEPKDSKKLRAMAKIAFQLNPRFREVTTGFYLRLCGLKSGREEIRKIKFMDHLEKDDRYFNLINRLVEIASQN